jgi:hypothetical protein
MFWKMSSYSLDEVTFKVILSMLWRQFTSFDVLELELPTPSPTISFNKLDGFWIREKLNPIRKYYPISPKLSSQNR